MPFLTYFISRRVALACVLLFALAVRATAGEIANGGFENALVGWDSIGLASIHGSEIGVTPPKGLSQAFLSTRVTPAVQAALGADLLEFLGVTYEDLDQLSVQPIAAGSGVQRTIPLKAGEELSFQYNFLTDDTNLGPVDIDFFNDLAFLVVRPPAGDAQLFSISDTTSASQPSSTEFAGETGFSKFSFTAQQSSNYVIGISVVSMTDIDGPSGLLLDDFLISRPGDYDRDSDVDGADFLKWQRDFAMTGAGLAADGNNDGSVNAADYTIWRNNYGIGVPATNASTGVPEPTSVGLAVLAACIFHMRFLR